MTQSSSEQSNSSKALRYVVCHVHRFADEPPVDVTVSYSTELPDAMYYAHHTARRYEGVIYIDFGGGPGTYGFIRSYRPPNKPKAITPPISEGV